MKEGDDMNDITILVTLVATDKNRARVYGLVKELVLEGALDESRANIFLACIEALDGMSS